MQHVSKEFPSSEALKNYLREHPKADKSKHHVKPEGKPEATNKDDDYFKSKWEKALSERLGRPATKADLDIIKGQMREFVKKEKTKEDPAFEEKPVDTTKPKENDPFVQQWGKALSQQLGRPATQEDIDILKGKMQQFVQKAKTASVPTRLMLRFKYARKVD